MPAEDLFHGHADFSYRCACPRGFDCGGQKVAALARRRLDSRQCGIADRLIPPCASFFDSRDLRRADLVIVDLEDVDRVFLVLAVFVDPDDHLFPPVDHRLPPGGGFLDPEFRHPAGDRLRHAAHAIDLFDQRPSLVGQFGGEAFDVVRAGKRIDDVGDSGLFLKDELGVPRDPGREVGRQSDGLVQRVGVQGLRSAEDGAHRLIGGADDIVVGVLLLQRDAGGLAVGTEHLGARVLGLELVHDARPEKPRGAELGGLHEEIHADGKEKAESSRELIDIHTAVDGGADVFAPVCQREGQFLHEVRAGLLHVVARNRDRVELGHEVRRVFDDVGHDPHRRFGRIDIGVPHHELFQDVVLDRARKERLVVPLLFAGHDEIGENRDHRAVHGHRDRHLIERDAVEEDLHVLDRIDGDARLADVAHDARMIAVIAPVGGEVEGDRHALLSGGERAAVKGVRLFRRGEPGILPDGPRAACIHRRLDAASEGGEPGHRAHMRQLLGIRFGVERFHADAFEGLPVEIFERSAPKLFLGKRFPIRHDGISCGGVSRVKRP